MYTPSTTTSEAIENRKWWVIDLEGATLGRAATRIAHVLRGKHKVTFTPHVDDGDYVIAVNVGKVNLTGNKWQDKRYYSHSGYVGGLKEATAEEMRARHPDHILRQAVKGMLPKGPLGRAQLKKLKIFEGAEHPHGSQAPAKLEMERFL